MQAFFQGLIHLKLNLNRQMTLPRAFQYEFAIEQPQQERLTGFIVVLPEAGCVYLFTRKGWKRQLKKLKNWTGAGTAPEERTEFLRDLQACVFPFSLDKTGRMTLPPAVKSTISSARAVILRGMGDKVEIWGEDEEKARIQRAGDQNNKRLEKLALILDSGDAEKGPGAEWWPVDEDTGRTDDG